MASFFFFFILNCDYFYTMIFGRDGKIEKSKVELVAVGIGSWFKDLEGFYKGWLSHKPCIHKILLMSHLTKDILISYSM